MKCDKYTRYMYNDTRYGNEGHTHVPKLRRDGESHACTHALTSDKGHTHTHTHTPTLRKTGGAGRGSAYGVGVVERVVG